MPREAAPYFGKSQGYWYAEKDRDGFYEIALMCRLPDFYFGAWSDVSFKKKDSGSFFSEASLPRTKIGLIIKKKTPPKSTTQMIYR